MKLRDGTNKVRHLQWFSESLRASPGSKVVYNYASSFFHGYSGIFKNESIQALRTSSDVEYVIVDSIVTTSETVRQ